MKKKIDPYKYVSIGVDPRDVQEFDAEAIAALDAKLEMTPEERHASLLAGFEKAMKSGCPNLTRSQEIAQMIDRGEISIPDAVRPEFAQMAANFEAMGVPLEDFVAQCWKAKEEADKA